LINKWNMVPDDDKNLCPLLECLTSIALALGPGFQPFTEPIFMRCAKLIEQTLYSQMLANQQQGDPPEKDFMVCALDLISGLTEGLESQIQPLLVRTNFLSLLHECMQDQDVDVRQSSFALVGDLAKCCINELNPVLNQYIPLLTSNINPKYTAVCNNACWALGEIALKSPNGIRHFSLHIINQLSMLFNIKHLVRGLVENTAITVGRIAYVCPDIIAPHLDSFMMGWCLALRLLQDNPEKDSAFRGLCSLIKANPEAVSRHFILVCDAIASWQQPQDDLRELFFQILHSFKNSISQDSWNQYFLSENFPENLRMTLQQRYQL